VKTQGARLVETLCDNVDGAVSFLTLFCCQAVALAFNPATGSIASIAAVQESFYPAEYQMYTGSAFLNAEPEIVAETCLVALTAISYILPRRADLVPVFEDSLAMNIDRLLAPGDNPLSVLLRSRMSLLLGYYADMIFPKYESAFVKVINFLVGSLALTGNQKAVAMQSADTLNTIISDKDLVPRLEPYLPALMPVMNDCTGKVHNKLYFSFLLDFVKSYAEAIGEDVVPFVVSLVARVLSELKACHEKGEKNNLVINKCWNVLRLILENDAFMPRYAAAFEKALQPLFEFMTDPSRVEFEDDIVLSMKSFVRKTGAVSDVMWTLFPYLQAVFEKNKHTFGNLLDTVN